MAQVLVRLLVNLPTCWPSPIYGLEVLGQAATWAVAGLGVLTLLRGQAWGVWAVLLAMALRSLGGGFFSQDDLIRFSWYYGALGAVSLAFLVVCHVLRPTGAWARSGLLVGLAFLSCACWWTTGRVAVAASAEVNRATDVYQAGRVEEGVAGWEQVIARYPGSSAWGVALFNTGLDLREQHRYPEAIARFETLLASRLDDAAGTGNLMRTSQNYHHNACLQLSHCYESLGDRAAALRYAILARDRYHFVTWCGTCQLDAERHLQLLIDRLEHGGPNPDLF
jgi:tetratricopeptide (TPR) repeat protein